MVIFRAPVGVIVSAKFALAFCAGLPESLTLNVKAVALADAVGVPVIAPVAAFNVSPEGSVPLVRVQVYGGVPPDADKEALYGAPTWPLGRDTVVIANAPVAIVSVRVALAFCAGLPESLTLNIKAVALAGAVGVPVIAPEVAFNVSPAGSVPLVRVHVYGEVPPDADKEAL